jgi:hypothetical protein
MFKRLLMVLCLAGSGWTAAYAQGLDPLAMPQSPLMDEPHHPSRDQMIDHAFMRRMEIAQRKADARRARIEAQHWMGFSPLRPSAAAMPMTNSYYYQPPQPFIFVFPRYSNQVDGPFGFSASL